MFIFAALKVYPGKWDEVANRPFDKEEIEAVAKATVVDSQYGMSVCFIMKSGGQTYIPLDTASTLSVGDSVDLTKARLITLSRANDKDIYRVRI